MQQVTLEGFALSQMSLYDMCKKTNTSEADTIEKLIVPIIDRLYSFPLYFERASRAARGSSIRKWDLQYFRVNNVGGKVEEDLLGLVECKNIHEEFRAHVKDGRWDFLNRCGNGQSIKKYVEGVNGKGSANAKGDNILQVWIYCNSSKHTKPAKANIIWTNGKKWVVFERSFFNSGENPPVDIKFGPKGDPAFENKYFHILEFPEKNDTDAIAKWGKVFISLREHLSRNCEGEIIIQAFGDK